MLLTAHECVDVMNDLESCGGCVELARDGQRSEDGGRDCSAIPHIDTVSCQLGKCIIESCRPGYTVSRNGQDCVANTAVPQPLVVNVGRSFGGLEL